MASPPSRLGYQDRTGQDHIRCERKNTRTRYKRVLLHQTIELATELAKNGMFYVQLLSDYVLVVSPPLNAILPCIPIKYALPPSLNAECHVT